MNTFKILVAALALAAAAPAFAGLCCNYGSPNGPAMNGIAKAAPSPAQRAAKPAQPAHPRVTK